MKKIIAAAAAIALLSAFGCAQKPNQAPVNSGHYASHPFHGGKLSKMGDQ